MERWHQRYSIELFKEVIADLYEIDKASITDDPQRIDSYIIIDKCMHMNIYELGVHYKEHIENKAHNLGLKGIWIDLNDLSKDEGCFFRHCHEVYLDLKEYENNKCCMSQSSGS